MTKKFKLIGILLLVAAVFLLAAFGVWLGSAFSGGWNRNAYSPYSAVYLSNGDMYFGALSWFPKPRLSNVWLLQRQVDGNNQPQFSVAEFTKAFWAPVDEIYLNPKQIVWWSRLRNDSQLALVMNNPSLLDQQQQQSASTSTFKGQSTPPPAKSQ